MLCRTIFDKVTKVCIGTKRGRVDRTRFLCIWTGKQRFDKLIKVCIRVKTGVLDRMKKVCISVQQCQKLGGREVHLTK